MSSADKFLRTLTQQYLRMLQSPVTDSLGMKLFLHLIDNGVDLSTTSDDGTNVLMLEGITSEFVSEILSRGGRILVNETAVKRARDPEILDLFLSCGFDIKCVTGQRLAVNFLSAGRLDMLKVFVKHGLQIGGMSEEGRSLILSDWDKLNFNIERIPYPSPKKRYTYVPPENLRW